MIVKRETDKVIIIYKNWQTRLLSWSIVICAGCFLWNSLMGYKDYQYDINIINEQIGSLNSKLTKLQNTTTKEILFIENTINQEK